jgi:hypothetical protein
LVALTVGYALGRARPVKRLHGWASWRSRGYGWGDRKPGAVRLALVVLVLMVMSPVQFRRLWLYVITFGKVAPPSRRQESPLFVRPVAEWAGQTAPGLAREERS